MPDTSHLAWKVTSKIAENKLLDVVHDREGNHTMKLEKNFMRDGTRTLKNSTVSTFNKKLGAFAQGGEDDVTVIDELSSPDFSFGGEDTTADDN